MAGEAGTDPGRAKDALTSDFSDGESLTMFASLLALLLLELELDADNGVGEARISRPPISLLLARRGVGPARPRTPGSGWRLTLARQGHGRNTSEFPDLFLFVCTCI